MSRSLIPKSKAKTAYGLLSEIRRIILAEPKRYNQNGYLITGSESEFAPRCGTVGCVAGWVNVLKGPPEFSVWAGIERARDILGIDGYEWDLFDSNAVGDSGDTPRTMAAHARRGAKHIAKFQKKYAKQLKAKKV